IFLDPIVTGNAAIQIAMLDVAADLLGANHPDLHLRVVHVRDVRAAADRNVVTRLGHLLDGRLLKAAFGQSDPQNPLVLHAFSLPFLALQSDFFLCWMAATVTSLST